MYNNLLVQPEVSPFQVYYLDCGLLYFKKVVEMKFSALDGGYKSSKGRIEGTMTLKMLVSLIRCHPEQEKIHELRTKVMTKKEYDKCKGELNFCIKPHGVFEHYYTKKAGKTALQYRLKQLSNFLYFDIDKCDVEQTRESLLSKHHDKIALLGQSVGGKGIFFYVKIANGDSLTPENFMTHWDYLQTEVFKDFRIDTSAKGLARNNVVSFDTNVYVNESAGYYIGSYESKVSTERSITSHNKEKKEECNRSCDTFLDIAECKEHIKWKTEIEMGDELYVIGDFYNGNLFVPKVIKDNYKHKTFRAMVNAIVYNNPSIEVKYILSFINFINTNYTGADPMKQQEMIYTVTTEFNRIKETGDYIGLKKKKFYINKNYKGNKQKLGCELNGKLTIQNSVDAIRIVYEYLQAKGIERPKPKQVYTVMQDYCEMHGLKGRSYVTIKRRLKKVEADINADATKALPQLGESLKEAVIVLQQEVTTKQDFFMTHLSRNLL